MERIFAAWGRILSGDMPALSIEITRECPLRCPGCYAYGDDHLGGSVTLREVRDYKGQALIDGYADGLLRGRSVEVRSVGQIALRCIRDVEQILARTTNELVRVGGDYVEYAEYD